MDTNWLRALALDSLGDFEVSAELDQTLSELAEWSQMRDTASRELLRLLAWKIERFVLRFRDWDLAPYDLDDVIQEAFLVFLSTIRRWRPRYVDGQAAGYLYYFLKVFPLWLSRRVRSWRKPAKSPVARLIQPDLHEPGIPIDFCRNLSPQESTLVELRLQRGYTMTRAAQSLGIARRTAYRRWHRILELSREYLKEAG